PGEPARLPAGRARELPARARLRHAARVSRGVDTAARRVLVPGPAGLRAAAPRLPRLPAAAAAAAAAARLRLRPGPAAGRLRRRLRRAAQLPPAARLR